MVHVTITAHTNSAESALELCRTFFLRYDMRLRPGWIRGGCGTHVDDPQRVLIFHEWGSRAAWDASQREELNANRLQTIAHLLARDLEVDVYEER